MKERKYIAIAIDENGTIWKGHFGVAPTYLIFDYNKNLIEERRNPYGIGSENHSHHDNPKLIISFLNDCNVFIGRRMGQQSRVKLGENFGITPFLTEITSPQEALINFLSNEKR